MRAELRSLIPERDLDDLLLALNEAATNAVLYGSGGGQPVEVVIRVRQGWAEVSVLDHGPAQRAVSGRGLGVEPEIARYGGRGLWLMGRLVDEVRLERVDLGTRVTLRRRIAARDGPANGRLA